MVDNLRGAFNLREAAQFAGVSVPTMLSWLNMVDFPAFKSGTRWIIPVDSFRQWLADKAAQRATLPGRNEQ